MQARWLSQIKNYVKEAGGNFLKKKVAEKAGKEAVKQANKKADKVEAEANKKANSIEAKAKKEADKIMTEVENK